MSRRNLYLHMVNCGLISNHVQPLNDFTKQISRSEWELLTNRKKREYNRFAMANNIPIYAREKNSKD